jgi:hypothetical protein
MNSKAKKIVAAAQVEGEDRQWYIQCDMHYISPDRPVAVLFWGPGMEIHGARTHPLDPQLLALSQDEGVAFRYVGDPIPIPKALAELCPEGLSVAGFRLGFFPIPSD